MPDIPDWLVSQSATGPNSPGVTRPPSEDEKRAVAYEMYRARTQGTNPTSTPQQEQEDWAVAEAQLKPLNLQDLEKLRNETKVVDAYLHTISSSNSGSQWTNTTNERGYYVIIGRGFSAAVDHATLLHEQSRPQLPSGGGPRLGDLEVIHLGFPDPWLKYRDHEMNQEQELLTLPGFINQLPRFGEPAPDPKLHTAIACIETGAPSLTRGTPFVRSGSFAQTTASEFQKIAEAEQFGNNPIREARVVAITRGGLDWYRVYTSVGAVIRAAKIDICSGPGLSRTLSRKRQGVRDSYAVDMSDDLWLEYTNPAKSDADNYSPRIITGSEYTRANVQTKQGSSVYVQGRGPAAGQAVEEAIRMGASQVLLLSSDISAAFTPNSRLDFLAQIKVGNTFRHLPSPRLSPVSGTIVPRLKRLWIAQNYKATAFETLTEDRIRSLELGGFVLGPRRLTTADLGRVLVTFAVDKADRPTNVWNCQGDSLPNLRYGVFDQAILAQGLQDALPEPGENLGTGLQLIKQLGSLNIHFDLLKADGYDHAVGLRSSDGRIRLLGSAGLGNKGIRDLSRFKSQFVGPSELAEYENSLPAQARVFLQGITLNAALIAQANRFFIPTIQECCNPNVNTATKSELKTRLGGDEQVASKILDARRYRIEPFHNLKELVLAISLAEKNVTDFAQYNNIDETQLLTSTETELFNKIDGANLQCMYEAVKAHPPRTQQPVAVPNHQ